MKPTLHLIGIFHTKHQSSFSHCAFTGKALRFPKMMQIYEYKVIEYSNEGSESTADEKVVMLSHSEYEENYISRKNTDFYGDDAVIGKPAHQAFEAKLILALRERLQPQDIICHPFGHAHSILMEEFPNHQHIETGIGYPTLMPNSFRIFESYAWMHNHQAKENRSGKNYEWVVPNYYDLNDWEPKYEKGKYIAFLGRISAIKGFDTIRAIADYSPYPIVLHGQGDPSQWSHPNIHYKGPIHGKERSEFLRNARAILAPSTFIEPFCGMTVEAMLCGTPVITVDYGAMTETVQEGMGFRCHTLQDWLDAVDDVGDLDRKYIADTARSKYSLESCGKKYDKIFMQLNDLYRKGWYEVNKPHLYESLFQKTLIELSGKEQQFVIVGAMDGASHDRLYPHTFKNKHWKGILIEPVKDYFEKLKDNYEHRDNLIFENVAVTDSLEEREIYTVDRNAILSGEVPFWCNGISTFNPDGPTISKEGIQDKVSTEIVKCCTFQELVNKHQLQQIDILQIDVEGFDYEVFNQIWKCGFRPKLIHIEIVQMSEEQKNSIQKILQWNNYQTEIQGDDLVAVSSRPPSIVLSKRKRVAFYTLSRWAFGSIHSALCKELYEYDIDADILDWGQSYTPDEWKDFDRIYDLFVTTPSDGVGSLVNNHIPYHKIIAIAHGERDIDGGIHYQNDFDSLLGYAAVSPSLVEYSKRLGITREMKVVRNGIVFDRYYNQIPSNLSVLGYAGSLNHHSFDNSKDCKRSYLVTQIAEKLNIPLVIAQPQDGTLRSYLRMPEYYSQVDCILVSSNASESCALPLMEAAASGRLPISARIGITCDFENPPGLILPMNDEDYVYEGVEKINELIKNPKKFRSMCKDSQDFAREHYDWKAVIGMWADLLTSH